LRILGGPCGTVLEGGFVSLAREEPDFRAHVGAVTKAAVMAVPVSRVAAMGVVAMHEVEDGSKMEQSTNPQLDRRIKKFTSTLKKEFAADIAENPSAFRSKVIGGMRARLPRSRPGRRASPEIRKASEIYQRDYVPKLKEGNWHLIAREVFPDYSSLPPEIQRLRRMTLRAAVHSLRYEALARKRRSIRASA